jgi:hypothetical protein
MALASEEEKLKLAEANLALTGKNAILESHNNTLKEEVVHLEEVVEHQEPYARLGAGLAHIDENDLDIGTFAKVHTDIGPKNIFITLREIGFLIPKSNLPYQEHIKTKRAKIIRVPRDKQSSIVVEKTLLTPKGQKYIMKKLYELEQKKLVSNNCYMLSEDDF